MDVLCCICPMGHFVLIHVLAMCAVAPVTVCCKFIFINKKNVSNWMKNGCVVMVCGMDSDVAFCVPHIEFCLIAQFLVWPADYP